MTSEKRNGTKHKRTPNRFIAPQCSLETPSSSTATTDLPQISSVPSGSQNLPPQNQNNNDENPPPPFIPAANYVLPPASEILALVHDKENLQKLKDLQCTSIDTFYNLLHSENELWKVDQVTGKHVLDVFEYKKEFEPLDPVYDDIITWVKNNSPMSELPDLSHIPVFQGQVAVVPAPPFITEFSKLSVLVPMNMHNLVTLFMDVKEWSDCFYDQVSNVEVLETILVGLDGPRDHNRSLKLISAEFHLPSPLVETRKCYFLRSAHKLLNCTGWVVVDVSLDSIFPNMSGKYIKKPSGCPIEACGIQGHSKVTWMEHVEVDNSMVHNFCEPLVTSGYGFGAARWVATLIRKVAWATSYYGNPEVVHGCGKALMRMAARMTKSFILGISASSENKWEPLPLPGTEDILVRTNYNTDDEGSPPGLVVTVATTIWLQAHPCRVFHFLREARNRHKWDLLSFNRPTQEILRVKTDNHRGGNISVIPVLSTAVPVMFNLQEVSVGETCTYIVYAPINMYALHVVLQGHDPENVQLLSSGFAIMPDREPSFGDNTIKTILTFSFQVAAGENATASGIMSQNSVATFHKIVTETTSVIKAATEG